MEAEKTRIYRKVAPDDRGTRWLSTIIRRCGFIKPNMFERRNAENKEARKESVTEELYKETKAFWATLCGGQKAVTAIPVISIAHKFTREQAEKLSRKDLKIQLIFVHT
jgi:hypothetical protein